MATGGDEAKRAFDAMVPMQKIDVATIKTALRGRQQAPPQRLIRLTECEPPLPTH
jgi:hypothetical protein